MSLQEIIERAIPLEPCPQKKAHAIYRRAQLEKRILEYISKIVEEKLKEIEQPA